MKHAIEGAIKYEAEVYDDSRVSQAVREGIDCPLPAISREEDRRLRDLASTAGVSWQALGHQVLPGHSKVH